jgi:hypothetical protein
MTEEEYNRLYEAVMFGASERAENRDVGVKIWRQFQYQKQKHQIEMERDVEMMDKCMYPDCCVSDSIVCCNRINNRK